VANGRSIARINAAEKRQRVVDARFAGNSWSKVAEISGYSCAESAMRAFSQAMRDKPAQNADEVRAQETERIEYLWSKVAEVVERPPLVHSAIGKTVPDPRTPGAFLVDERAKISAITEYRRLSESYRKLCGADIGGANAPDPTPDSELIELHQWARNLAPRVKQLTTENLTLGAENADLRRQLAEWENGSVTVAEVVAEMPPGGAEMDQEPAAHPWG
jgi:hypothetical protein